MIVEDRKCRRAEKMTYFILRGGQFTRVRRYRLSIRIIPDLVM